MVHRLKDPASALTHLVGALLSMAGLAALIWHGASQGTPSHIAAFLVFGISLILLYTASTLYHSLTLSPQATLVMRKFDHMAIFVLIAGTYTPFCLVPLRDAGGWPLFWAVWGCALVGMGVKLFWMQAPRWLSTAFYVLMGWLIVAAIRPLAQNVSASSLVWLVTGGVLYTVGAVFYATKWPKLWPGRFGFHEVWHLFVMAGSLAHFVAVYQLI